MARICDRCDRKTEAKVSVQMTTRGFKEGIEAGLARYDLCDGCLTALTRDLKEFMNPPREALKEG